jgi:hypothetical protein
MAGLVPAIHVLLYSENGRRLGLFYDQSAQLVLRLDAAARNRYACHDHDGAAPVLPLA